jgi:hypothetical protein
MKSQAKVTLSCSTTARSRSNLPIETAMQPSSKPSASLFQQPAKEPV